MILEMIDAAEVRTHNVQDMEDIACLIRTYTSKSYESDSTEMDFL